MDDETYLRGPSFCVRLFRALGGMTLRARVGDSNYTHIHSLLTSVDMHFWHLRSSLSQTQYFKV
jgi:hypothetical protein